MDGVYDVIVVGAGLIGSAAARHLVEISPGLKVLLVGPEEPQDRSCTDIFGAHYDEGRITKALDRDATWGQLTRRSIRCYRDIERRSGIQFYHEVGSLVLGRAGGEYTRTVLSLSADLGEQATLLDSRQLHSQFPFIAQCDTVEGIFTNQNAGHISARNLLRAQQLLAEKGGCDVIRDIVREITVSGSELYDVTLEGANGTVAGRRVLVATGAFVHCRNLLPDNLQLDIQMFGNTVLLAEVDEAEVRARGLDSMPIVTSDRHLVVATGAGGAEAAEGGTRYKCYILPPIKYPDGHVYMKLGIQYQATTALRVPLLSPHEMALWYRGAHPRCAHVNTLLGDAMRAHFPDVRFTRFRFDHCVTDVTRTSQAHVDVLRPRFGVALGGNGNAAKCSDEIGKMAARMMLHGTWDYDLPAETFRARFIPSSSDSNGTNPPK